MNNLEKTEHFKAVFFLILTTALWAISFPCMKTLAIMQKNIPLSEWYQSIFFMVLRFGVSILGSLIFFPSLKNITRYEISQGIGMGLFGGIGILFQAHGLFFTSAFTSAFLTQFSVILVPLVITLYLRKIPPVNMIFASLLALVSIAILSGFDIKTLKIGRGEAETLIATFFFTAHILWLQRKIFSKNSAWHSLFIMNLTAFVLFLIVCIFSGSLINMWTGLKLYLFSPVAFLMVIITSLISTLLANYLMTRWQPKVTPPQATIIYCFEPLFNSGYVLFLPGLISAIAKINYPNERITSSMLIGGILLIISNLLTELKSIIPKRE